MTITQTHTPFSCRISPVVFLTLTISLAVLATGCGEAGDGEADGLGTQTQALLSGAGGTGGQAGTGPAGGQAGTGGAGDQADIDEVGQTGTDEQSGSDPYEGLAEEIGEAIENDPELEEEIAKKVAKVAVKAIKQGEGLFCDDLVYAALYDLPRVPFGQSGFDIDRSFDLDDKSVELTCRYDYYGQIDSYRRYHCCLYGETTYGLGDGFQDTTIGARAAIQLGRRSRLNVQAYRNFDDDESFVEVGFQFGARLRR